MFGYSSVGRTQLAGQVGFLFMDLVVLGLAFRVNEFQGYFYMADIFPLIMAVLTGVFLFVVIILDLVSENAMLARPQYQGVSLAFLSIFWLAFNAFSTSRWRKVPLQCSSIPSDFEDERDWCRGLQALKSFVWINWLICLGLCVALFRYSIKQYNRGQKHVFQGPLSRYRPASVEDRMSQVMGGEFWAR